MTRVDAPREFEDVMVRGPFRSMRHIHRFEPRPAGTLMVDDFTYKAPLAPLSEHVLTPYLARFLRERAASLKAEAEAAVRR